MAILSGIGLSKATNKLGNMVLSNRSGIGVVAREYVANPNNPRTTKQMERRVKWANLVNFYRLSKGWMPKAFENKSAKQSDYNKFMSLNASNNPVSLTKDLADAGAVVMAPYVISYGSLQPVEITGRREEDDAYLSNIQISFDFGSDLTATAIADISASILANNPHIQQGDQISFISYQEKYVGTVPFATCRAFAFPIDVNNTNQTLGDYLPEWLCYANAAEGEIGVSYLGCRDLSKGGFAWVLSRTIGGKIRVSTQRLYVDSGLADRFTSAAYEAESIASYGMSTQVFLDSRGQLSEEAAPVPVVIESVGSVSPRKHYYPGQVFPVADISGKLCSAVVSGLETTEFTRVGIKTFGNTEQLFSITSAETEIVQFNCGSLSGSNVELVTLYVGNSARGTARFALTQGGGMESE